MNKWYEFQQNYFKKNTHHIPFSVPPRLKELLHSIKDRYHAGEYPTYTSPAFEPVEYINALKGGYPGVTDEQITDLVMDTTCEKMMSADSMEVIQIDDPEIELFGELLGNKVSVRFHNQKPGQMFPMHYDRPKFENDEIKLERRGIIFLTDWVDGQTFQLGTEFLKWEAFNKMYCWDHVDLQHGSANFGYADRLAVIVTWKEDH